MRNARSMGGIHVFDPAFSNARAKAGDPRYQAFLVLWVGFTVAPIIAGADKFFNVLADWGAYLAPQIEALIPMSTSNFMLLVGGIEMAAGILVGIRPHIFGYVVSIWLLGIVINLMIGGQYYDIALRDFGLAIGAFSLARQAQGWRMAESRA